MRAQYSTALGRCATGALLALLGWSLPARALDPEPPGRDATWSEATWGIVIAVPRMARIGDQIHIHAMVVGGPAAEPWWSCSQYSAWTANGTGDVALVVPRDWDMPFTGYDMFDNKVNAMHRDAGDPPPYGWEGRVSDTCYCVVTDFGAQGGCDSREVQPALFHLMDQFNPREGNVQFATVTSGRGWSWVQARFSGYAGVAWGDWAEDHVYVVADESQLDEDSDHDGISDAWEYAHSPTQSLDDFGGTAARSRDAAPAAAAWTDPYAPRAVDWVPAAVGDWDGDGVTDRDEYLRWKARRTDGDGVAYDPTYINAPPRARSDSGCDAGGASAPAAAWLALLGALARARRAAG